MSYQGQVFRIPLGTRGLVTDDVPGRVPFDSLLRATNVTCRDGLVEKDPGSWRWNLSAIGSGIIAFSDFWPNDVIQRIFTLTRDGIVRKYSDRETLTTVAKSGAAPTTLTLSSNRQPMFVQGGAESAGRARKLFLFTGSSPVQVMSGDAVVRTNLTTPAADWTTSYPTNGLMHKNRLVAFGNRSDPHRFYMSQTGDHENFTGTGALQFSVYPGEGEGLMSACVYKGRLFLFKTPYGAYYLDDSAVDYANWSIVKVSGTFGVASGFSAFSVLDDLFVANSTGSVTSLSATQKFGDVESGDLFRSLRNESYMRQNTSRNGTPNRYAVYYEDRKTALLTYQSAGGIRNDRICAIDFNDANSVKVTWGDKDQPTCLGLMKDTLGVSRPLYGAEDGYLYVMDWATREVESGTAYNGDFRTVDLDMGSADPGLAEKTKLFDFLEVSFEEAGNWNLNVDVYIDGVFSETLTFLMTKQTHLTGFPLGTADAVGRTPQSYRKPLHGTGRRISFRCYNSGLRQTFRISSLNVYFRAAGEEQKS